MTGLLFALAFAYAYPARAGEVVSGDVFSSGTSLEKQAVGAFNPRESDDGDQYGPYHWLSGAEEDFEQVVAYAPGAAYDYAAHGLLRNPYLAASTAGANDKFLLLDSDSKLHRSIFRRLEPDGAFSNVVVRTATRESIYCDMLVQFSAGEEPPVFDSNARIVVWSRLVENESGDGMLTNLMVTAGSFTNGFRGVNVRHYPLELDPADFPEGLDLSKWYRLTIRAHGDISTQGAGLSGFSIYLDGKPLRGAASDYVVCEAQYARSSALMPEARALIAARRLFPGLSAPGTDASFTISGLTFLGEGRLDDVSFASGDPGYAAPEAVFTLNWDAGIKSLKYTLPAAGGALTTNTAPVLDARSADILIGSASATNELRGLVLTAVDVAYDTANGYRNGLWFGANGAELTNDVAFVVVDPSTRNPIANVASTRDFIGVGGSGPGCVDTFYEAFASLDRSTNAVKMIVLNNDLVIARDTRDRGAVQALNLDGEYVLDLNGHTLKGAGRVPTVCVSCKSFRIYDSSEFKTGRIEPVDSYTNAIPEENTSVMVYPRKGRDGQYNEPVVTLQGGIYDGWVRNEGHVDYDSAVVGVVFVEGGSYYSTNAASFYLDSCVTNASAQFIYRDSYWACLATNAVIWTGKGDGLHWTDPENWKSHTVPTASDTALFPANPEPWTVDVRDNEMTTMKLWLEGDVDLSGTNAFRTVSLRADAPGRFLGDATLVYDGDQPAKLTETTLRADWAGTVLLKNVGTSVPKTLKNLEYWGTPDSTVVFNGVRGYVMDTASHTMTYGLVLRDYVYTNGSGATVTNLAWQNDSGYTGSTLAFTGALSGDGTFRSGANVRAVLQLFKFANVTNFTGRFSVEGKRVLVGSETVMTSTAGLIAFGDHAVVNAGLGWTCQKAIFGETLYVQGDTNDVLVTVTSRNASAEPDVTSCTNIFLNGVRDIAWLAVRTNSLTTLSKSWSVYVTGVRPAHIPEPAPESLAPPAVFLSAPVPLASSSSDYETAALRPSAYIQAVAAVRVADVSIEIGEEEILVVISNASRGLWYGVRYRASLSDDWGMPGEWREATGPTVVLTCPKQGDSGFYEVVVSYENPYSSGGGGE